MDESSVRKALARLGVAVIGRSQTGWLQGHCPLAPWTHEKGTDNHPAFAVMVNEDGPSFYKCLACKHKGRVSQLVRTLEGYRETKYPGLAIECDMADANGAFGSGFDVTTHMIGYDEPEAIDETAISGAYPPAYSIPEAAAYLQKRGIGPGTAELLQLMYDPSDMRIMFPVRGQTGELYGFSGRSILDEGVKPNPGYRGNYPKIRDYLGLPKRHLLLGMHLYQPGKPMFAIEGLIGFASLVQQGARDVCNPVALMGSEMTPQKATVLSMLDERVYLLPDDDEAGAGCLWGNFNEKTGDYNDDGAITRLRQKGLAVFVPEWPAGLNDPDQLRFEHVEAMIRDCPLWTG